jgi:Ca2+-binding EF-hand superfamily protein
MEVEMNISSNSGGYGDPGLLALQRLLQPDAAQAAGQNVQGADSDGDGDSSGSSGAPPPAPPGQAQLADRTLSSLVDLQASPPSASDIASTLLGAFDANKDGSLSLDEVQTALAKMGDTADASKVKDAFAKLDTNGDGSLSTDELTAAIQAHQKAGHAHHGHHGHGPHGAPPSSDQLAQDILSAADSNGDGVLSLDEIAAALDPQGSSQTGSSQTGSSQTGASQTGASQTASATDPAATALKDAVAKLDANGDGSLSADELKAAIDAFRQAQQAAWTQAADQAGAAASTAA